MDDRRFDDIVKGKVENYQPEAFDPAALADLHHRMAAIPVQLPWYSNYRTGIWILQYLQSAKCLLCLLPDKPGNQSA